MEENISNENKLSSMKELQEKDAEINELKEKFKAERNDVPYMDKRVLEEKERCQEAVKDIEWLTQLREYDTYTELDKLYAIQTKYGLNKKEN